MMKRDRMVSVRLSHDEYERLREVCGEMGARSISDLARLAMQRVADGVVGEPAGLELKVQMLTERVARLQKELTEVRGIVKGVAV